MANADRPCRRRRANGARRRRPVPPPRGLRSARGDRRRRSTRRAAARLAEPRRARPHAPRRRRPRPLPGDPRRLGAARDHVDGACRRGRSHRGAGARGRRLRHEALFSARADGARPDGAAQVENAGRPRRPDRLRRARDRHGNSGGPRAQLPRSPDGEGVRPHRVPGTSSSTGLLPATADGRRLGIRGSLGHGNGHRPHPPAQGEDRDRPSRPCRIETVWGVGYRFRP